MAINGGQPHAVGDKGQQFEVTFHDPGYEGDSRMRKVFGWAATQNGAQAMVDAINAHPTWTAPRIEDRHALPTNTQVNAPCGRTEAE